MLRVQPLARGKLPRRFTPRLSPQRAAPSRATISHNRLLNDRPSPPGKLRSAAWVTIRSAPSNCYCGAAAICRFSSAEVSIAPRLFLPAQAITSPMHARASRWRIGDCDEHQRWIRRFAQARRTMLALARLNACADEVPGAGHAAMRVINSSAIGHTFPGQPTYAYVLGLLFSKMPYHGPNRASHDQ